MAPASSPNAAAAALVFLAVASLLAAAATAQDGAAAPTPAMDAGSGFRLPVSAALVCSSLLLSVLALFSR
ncbi:hypothetical protein ACLOJK_030210 [Asimina triloba]